MWRYRRQGQTGGPLLRVLLAGTLPGVVAGSAIRMYLLPGQAVFDLVVAAVLIPLGTWIALTRPAGAGTSGHNRLPSVVLGLIAAVAGCAGLQSALPTERRGPRGAERPHADRMHE